MGESQTENTNEINEINHKDEIIIHVEDSIRQLKKLLLTYIEDENTISKADKLAYWLEDYSKLLSFEENFNPNFLKSYHRGDVIKVNLGYNIGNEEGGLHYCIVVDKFNPKTSGIITVIPLTSFKGKPLHYSSVFLGNEIYLNFNEKYEKLMLELSKKINSINVKHSTQEEIHSALDDLVFAKKVNAEMSKMKKGSVALVSQITTISKQRIYDPQKKSDVLADLKISDKSLDLINEKMKKLFIKQ